MSVVRQESSHVWVQSFMTGKSVGMAPCRGAISCTLLGHVGCTGVPPLPPTLSVFRHEELGVDGTPLFITWQVSR